MTGRRQGGRPLLAHWWATVLGSENRTAGYQKISGTSALLTRTLTFRRRIIFQRSRPIQLKFSDQCPRVLLTSTPGSPTGLQVVTLSHLSGYSSRFNLSNINRPSPRT